MPFQAQDGLRYFSFESLSATTTHGVFSRRGGVSPAPWSSLNVGSMVGDDAARVRENRARTLAVFDRPEASIFDAWLVHSAEVLCADAPRPLADLPAQADVVLTDRPEVTLFLRFADCVPILLHDPVKAVVGIAHAGWLGTIRGVARAAVAELKRRYGCRPEDILAGIGPSIGPDHYQVGTDVVSQVQQAFGRESEAVLQSRDSKEYLDLWLGNMLQLQAMGVTQIETAGICTACNLDDWYSHRAEHGKTGRFGALLALPV